MNRLVQGKLLRIAGSFIFLQAVLLTLAPVVRERTWHTNLLWAHWVALAAWGLLAFLAHNNTKKYLPDADPYLLPAAALLSGLGILTIWRLEDAFGARQTLWFAFSMLAFIAGMRITSLQFLRRYKYTILISGLCLTGLTLLFGTNPSGIGPRLWLGCCDVYFQPSEPLKLLLVVFLSAYLAEKLPYRLKTIHIIFPTLILGGIVILLLLAQRDLGTASIFLGIYTVMIYLATNRKAVLIGSIIALVLVGIAGYYSVAIIQARVDSWLNPWVDPSGSSYQIIQGLIAIANGGIEGRGPGLGNPRLIPVAISDFIYAAISEETGLFGTLGLLALFGIIITRGLRTSLRAPDNFTRFLAAGISTYFGVQTILIVGGNIRLLPLTGVTLPFVSYGGSSLLTSFIALLVLLFISNHRDEEPAPLEKPVSYLSLNAFLLFGLFASALATGWWAIIQAPELLARDDNLRPKIAEKYVPRGTLLDRSSQPVSITSGKTGTFTRKYVYTDLGSVSGYNDLQYGQAGLESSLDGYLRGLEGNPASLIWINHLVYGMPPNGLDTRLSLDLYLQSRADEMMIEKKGAVILLNAESGEILVMSSHPTFNANYLKETANDLINDPQKPLLNRATLGLYPIGSAIEPFAQILYQTTEPDTEQLQTLYETFNFFNAPELRMDVAEPVSTKDGEYLLISPLQMALASASLSHYGIIPAPRIALAVDTPREDWVVLPALGTPFEAAQPSAVDESIASYIDDGNSYWSHIGMAENSESPVTWFIGGTPPNWQASPLTVVVLLEGNDPRGAQRIGQELLIDAMNP